ncbi:hypothetical protein J5681_08000 [bacterium]|nr:hypothetical protein [bacterium]
MKKFWMISMLLIAALFVISCGGDSEEEGGEGGNESKACTEQGAFRCSGDMLQKCDQEAWKNFEQCSADKPCNAEKGACVAAEEGGNQGGNEGGNQGGNEGGNQGGNEASGCVDIFMCMNGCAESDQACVQACYDNAPADAQNDYYAWYTCFSQYCENDPSAQCSVENCESESAKCGIAFEKGNEAYPAPYGRIDVNISSTYVITNETQLDQSMINMSYFATGTFGTSGNLQPMGAQGAYYYAALQDDAIQIFQTPYANNGQTTLNPAAVLVLNSDVATGEITVGLTQEDSGQLFIVDLNGNNIGCFHAFAVGSLTVNSMNTTPGAGANIAIIGSQIEIYSSENAPMYGGNITSQMGSGFTACQPM